MTDHVISSSGMRGSPQGAVLAALRGEDIPLDLSVPAATEYVQHCSEALDSLDPGDTLGGIRLRTAQIIGGAPLYSTPQDLLRAADSADAVRERAGEDGSAVAHAYALAAWGFTRQGPEHTDERVRAATFIVETAADAGESALLAAGYALLLVGLLEQGEIRSLDAQLLEQRVAASLRDGAAHDTPAQWLYCLRSILDGDAEAAEAQAEAMFAAAPAEGTDARALYSTRIGMIRWMQGRLDGAEEGFLAARREHPEQLLWAASLAWLWLLQGRRSSAENLRATFPDVTEIPHNRYWLSTVTVLAEHALVSGDRAEAEKLRTILVPFAAHLVPVGVGVAFWGTCARSLGLVEEFLGYLDAARTHLELAVEMCGRLGALAWHAEAQIELAEFGIRHGIADIPAYELLAEARMTSEARGFAALARRAMHRPRIRVLGGFEVISLCGTRAEWNSRKARELLKMLIAARGAAASREVFMDVLWPGEAPATLGNRFSVAVNVIRRALDPQRLLPTQHHLVTEGDSVWLNLDHLDVDLETFFALAEAPDEASRRAAAELYRGDAFADEPYADWATRVRERAQHVRSRLGD